MNDYQRSIIRRANLSGVFTLFFRRVVVDLWVDFVGIETELFTNDLKNVPLGPRRPGGLVPDFMTLRSMGIPNGMGRINV